jgi:hypothetical protein
MSDRNAWGRPRRLCARSAAGFKTAARHLNFRGTVDELFITQSAISRQIKPLATTTANNVAIPGYHPATALWLHHGEEVPCGSLQMAYRLAQQIFRPRR